MKLPQIAYNIQKNQQEMVQMRSINYSDALNDGDLADSLHLSARRHPYITARRKRQQLTGTAYTSATALTSWRKLVTVVGTKVYYDGTQISGSVTAGEKQFAVVNTKLIIWPDKKYIDLAASPMTLNDLGASTSGSGTTNFANDDSESTITVTRNVDFTTIFKVGDTVEVSGCSNTANNKSATIKAIAAKKLTFTSGAFTDASETGTITIARKIPDMDYICESENRLWGCSSSAQTIYASALGDPTNFYTYEGVSTDAYAVAVGTEGDFTGCCKLSSSVLFWKETVLHKMLGSYPAEYSMYTYNMEGLRAGCSKSLQVINETLYYVGLHGVYAYSGGTPSLISANFGQHEFVNAIAGNDGDTYFLSVQEQTGPNAYKNYFFLYETIRNLWVLEDNIRIKDFTRISKDLYFLDTEGRVWLHDSGEEDPDVNWLAQFTPFYETIQGRKTYSKLLLRMQLPQGSYMIAEIRTDNKPWQEVGRVYGADEDVSVMRIGLNRCDKFEIRLSGHGPFAILSILREFSLGSDV